MAKIANRTFRNVQIAKRNFSGKPGPKNQSGARKFLLLLDEKDAESMSDEGWNVKMFKPLEEGDQPQAFVEVEARYNSYPPKIVTVTSRGNTVLDEEMLGMLDYADIDKIDLVITPYEWDFDGESGIKAYVKTMYITLNEDELTIEYESRNEDQD